MHREANTTALACEERESLSQGQTARRQEVQLGAVSQIWDLVKRF